MQISVSKSSIVQGYTLHLAHARLRRIVSRTFTPRVISKFDDDVGFGGAGPHFCLGAHLARVQMRTLFTELLSRTSWIEPAGEAAYLRSNFQRGVKRLPIRWTG